jgi:hypothetical protein
VRIAHDRDSDVVYVTECYRMRETTVSVHAGALVPWGKKLPWAWPHDAFQHDKGSGIQIAQLYRQHGMNMLPEHAQLIGIGGRLTPPPLPHHRAYGSRTTAVRLGYVGAGT